MSEIDLEQLISKPIYALDFQRMIADIADFLDFSEINIELKYRYEISLPLKVRYGAVLSLITSVEWSVHIFEQWLTQPISYEDKPKGFNKTVYAISELENRTGIGNVEIVEDYKALVYVRNCIAHNAGIEKGYSYQRDLLEAVNRLSGFSLDNWSFFGKQVCIQKGALAPYIEKLHNFIVKCHESAEADGLLRSS